MFCVACAQAKKLGLYFKNDNTGWVRKMFKW